MQPSDFETAAISPAGEAHLSFAFGEHRIRITGAETAGRIGIWEEITTPGAGAPLHVHHAEDEMFFVLDGRVRFWCGEERFEAGVGATVVLPRGVPHRFENVGETALRMLVAVTPGGFETFFLDAAALTGVDETAIMSLAARYRLEFLPEPATRAA
ncbi:cupin domain-containing protein [Pararhodobacter sp. SW119]|uniref:cupin domain-containing protein n=1 Tax=Pararhodobacter sp. SW119 TaxID=2780075 RepID=UPI001AE05B19|nr:cupin domain-containing protein [Pararhodobacter sp. SW119]